jgi:hypothetical protein
VTNSIVHCVLAPLLWLACIMLMVAPQLLCHHLLFDDFPGTEKE